MGHCFSTPGTVKNGGAAPKDDDDATDACFRGLVEWLDIQVIGRWLRETLRLAMARAGDLYRMFLAVPVLRFALLVSQWGLTQYYLLFEVESYWGECFRQTYQKPTAVRLCSSGMLTARPSIHQWHHAMRSGTPVRQACWQRSNAPERALHPGAAGHQQS